ncbi:MAG TPA: hypothetical protein VK548_25035 [Candidatus Acidoferrum sp.]|nr:hypothetical protein [Candidatus Acidoferrum sp.]
MMKWITVLAVGAAAWYWRKEIGSMLDTQLPGLREKTMQTLDDALETVQRIPERLKSEGASS